MQQDPIAEKCSLMPDEELLRALTIEQDEYNDAFLKTARTELDKRGIDLSQLAARAKLRFNDREEETLPVEQIFARLKGDEIAPLNLGHLYFRDTRRNDRALMHFQKYLELKPEAEDRETIETIMAELRR